MGWAAAWIVPRRARAPEAVLGVSWLEGLLNIDICAIASAPPLRAILFRALSNELELEEFCSLSCGKCYDQPLLWHAPLALPRF